MTLHNPATIAEVGAFFRQQPNGMTLKEFSAEWKQLSDKDKEDLKKGIGNGSLNY